jgi:hypothetical protein
MSRKVQIIQPIPQLPVSRRGMKRWWLSATVYLALCVWLGPDAAFWLTVFAGSIGFWMLLCNRWPWLGYATGLFLSSFIGGFIMGLFGLRGGYYYGGYRGRRRRW